MSPETHESFLRIVAGGVLIGQGMPSFADRLSQDQIESIHQYLIKRQHDLAREMRQAPAATTPDAGATQRAGAAADQ